MSSLIGPYKTFPAYPSDAAAERAYWSIQDTVNSGYVPYYYNTTSSVIRVRGSSSWTDYGVGGTPLLADGSVALSGDLDLDSNKLVNVADGTNAGDAVNRSQLDAVVAGIKYKEACVVATTADLSATYDGAAGATSKGELTGVATSIDGYTLQVDDRVLVKNQSNANENGIYVVSAIPSTATLERSTDFDTDAEVDQSAITFILDGDVNTNSAWILLTEDPITVGGGSGSDLNWTAYSSPGNTGIVQLSDGALPKKDASNTKLIDSAIVEDTNYLGTSKPVKETIPSEATEDTTTTVTIDASNGNVFRYTCDCQSGQTISFDPITESLGNDELQTLSIFIKNKSSTADDLTLYFDSSWVFASGSSPTKIDTTDDILLIEGHLVTIDSTTLFLCTSVQITP